MSARGLSCSPFDWTHNGLWTPTSKSDVRPDSLKRQRTNRCSTARLTGRLPRLMPKLRATALIFASAVCAMVLSVGAALAEDHQPVAAKGAAAAKLPAGVCILHDLGIKN